MKENKYITYKMHDVSRKVILKRKLFYKHKLILCNNGFQYDILSMLTMF